MSKYYLRIDSEYYDEYQVYETIMTIPLGSHIMLHKSSKHNFIPSMFKKNEYIFSFGLPKDGYDKDIIFSDDQ